MARKDFDLRAALSEASTQHISVPPTTFYSFSGPQKCGRLRLDAGRVREMYRADNSTWSGTAATVYDETGAELGSGKLVGFAPTAVLPGPTRSAPQGPVPSEGDVVYVFADQSTLVWSSSQSVELDAPTV